MAQNRDGQRQEATGWVIYSHTDKDRTQPLKFPVAHVRLNQVFQGEFDTCRYRDGSYRTGVYNFSREALILFRDWLALNPTAEFQQNHLPLERELVSKVNPDILPECLPMAVHFQLESLADLLADAIVSNLTGLEPAEVGTKLGVHCDLGPQQIQALKLQNRWLPI